MNATESIWLKQKPLSVNFDLRKPATSVIYIRSNHQVVELTNINKLSIQLKRHRKPWWFLIFGVREKSPGEIPYKKVDGGARQKFRKELLAKILFCGRGLDIFLTWLRLTNSNKTTHLLTLIILITIKMIASNTFCS